MPSPVQAQHKLLLAKTTECEDYLKSLKDGDQFKTDVSDDQVKEFQKRQAELAVLDKQFESLKSLDSGYQDLLRRRAALTQPYDPAPYAGTDGTQLTLNGSGAIKSLGRQVVESERWKKFEPGPSQQVGIELEDFDGRNLKTLVTTAAGFVPANNRTDIVVPFGLRRPVVADLIPQEPTKLTVITYMVQTTSTNNAATVAEGAAKPESAMAWTPASANVRKIAHGIPVTDEQLEDVDQARTLIDAQLTAMLLLAEEGQLLNGLGTGTELLGFMNMVGIQVQARGTDPTPDAILYAMTLVRGGAGSGFAEPSGVVMNPNDWTKVRLLRTGPDGPYLFGNPGDAATVDRIWGKPVIATLAMTQGLALTGDFQTWSQIWRRLGVIVKAGWVNNQFVQNQQTILAEMREALTVYRPAAFCKVTGIPA